MPLAFSRGKDSLGAWLQLRRHGATVVPFYREVVPGLAFVEESLRWAEDFFATRILRYPDPALLAQLDDDALQTPSSSAWWSRPTSPVLPFDWTAERIRDDARAAAGVPGGFVAVGWRAADSFGRRRVLRKTRGLDVSGRAWMPIWDWTHTRLEGELRAAGVRLPIDYRFWGRSFEAIDGRFLPAIKQHMPEDWRRICAWFPLAEAYLERERFAQERST
ncbi:MAG: hypothetical protein SFW67_35450 [Myxococcaceae bacterium]|nr:hypothetical protein [Myxococcaceae bacterium]